MKKGKKKRLSRNERVSAYIGIHRVSAITVSVPSRTTVPPPSLSLHTHTPLIPRKRINALLQLYINRLRTYA